MIFDIKKPEEKSNKRKYSNKINKATSNKIITVENFILTEWQKSIKISYLNAIFLIHIIRTPINQIFKHIKALPRHLSYKIFRGQEHDT